MDATDDLQYKQYVVGVEAASYEFEVIPIELLPSADEMRQYEDNFYAKCQLDVNARRTNKPRLRDDHSSTFGAVDTMRLRKWRRKNSAGEKS